MSAGSVLQFAGSIFTLTGNPWIGIPLMMAGGYLNYRNQPDVEGPRLQDRTVQVSSYGMPIPRVYGSVRLAGNVIWPKNFQVDEVSNTQSAGKGGGPESTTYTYYATFAVLICAGNEDGTDIGGIGRIWMNKKLVVDADGNRDPCLTVAPRFHLGSETQEPDALMVATDGSAPAYRGYVYGVFENVELTESGFGSRPPSIEVEVFTNATTGGPADPRVVPLGASQTSGIATIDSTTNWIWSVKPTFLGSTLDISVISDVAEQVITTFSVACGAASIVSGVAAVGGEIWVLVRPWTASSHRAHIFVFTSGSANEDGTSSIDPVAVDDFYVTGTGQGSYAQQIAYDPTMGYVWITYSLTNAAVMEVNVVDPLSRSLVGYDSPGEVIGYPDNICVGGSYVAILGNSGGSNPNLLIYNAVTFNLLHTVTLPAAPQNAKAIDYDSARGVFVVMGQTLLEFSVVDPATGSFDSYTYSASADVDASPPVSSTITMGVTYYAKDDRYIFGCDGNVNDASTLYIVDPDALETEHTWTYELTADILQGPLLQNTVDGSYIIAFDDTPQAKRLMLGSTTVGGPVTLASIVSSICQHDPSGLEAADIDVTELTDLVDGYLLGQQMTRRSAIEPLQLAYFFDGVESDHKLKFPKRGQASAVSIPEADRAAHVDGAELPVNLSISRGSELELPWTIDINYTDQDTDYQVGTQYDRRITRNANAPVKFDLPIVMSAEKAKQVAIVNLYLPWLSRTKFGFSTGLEYAKYEPTDVVTLPTDDVTYNARLLSRSDKGNGVIQWEAELEDSNIYTQTGTVAANTFVPQTIANPGTTILQLLDTPILRDADDDAGYYVAMGGTTSGWRGAQLFKSADGGSTYEAMLVGLSAAAIGTTQDVLGDFTAGNIFDEGNSVTVNIRSGGPLVSATETQVLNGSNTAVIGSHGRWEVINFKTATLVSADTYLLSGLLRGRRGTEWATGTHAVADIFVLASTATWLRPVVGSAEIGLARLYKAPPLRMPLSAAASESFTNSAVGLTPYAPVSLTGTRDGSGNLTIGWTRRSRIGYGTLNATVPLGEDSESYSVDVMNGAAVARTLTSATQSVEYSAADQTTDFGSTQSSVTVRVYQISATVGRGTKLEGTI